MSLTEQELHQDESTREFFGFNATEFAFELKAAFEIHLNEALKEGLKTILNVADDKGDDELAAQDVVPKQLSNFQKYYLEKAEQPLKRIEKEVRELLSIPPNVELPKELPSNLHLAETKVTKEELKTQVEHLEKQVLQEKVFLEALKIKKRQFEQIRPLVQKVGEIIKSNTHGRQLILNTLLDKTISNLNIAEKNEDEICLDFQSELQPEERY